MGCWELWLREQGDWVGPGIWEAGGEDACGDCAECLAFSPVWFNANAPVQQTCSWIWCPLISKVADE